MTLIFPPEDISSPFNILNILETGLTYEELLNELKDNEDMQAKWIEFHHDKASLRYLCKSCNLHRKRNSLD